MFYLETVANIMLAYRIDKLKGLLRGCKLILGSIEGTLTIGRLELALEVTIILSIRVSHY